MPSYTTLEACERFLANGDFYAEMPKRIGAADEIIEAAEADIDRMLAFDLTPDPVTGRKLIPELLTPSQVTALSRAVCAQVAFRLEVGEDALTGADADLEGAGNVRLGPTPRPPSPAAVEALSGHGFPWRSGTVAPDPPMPGQTWIV
jgi:hypothetical protein